MNERRELADRIERSVSYFAGEITGIYLNPNERNLIVAALCSTSLPSKEAIIKAICCPMGCQFPKTWTCKYANEQNEDKYCAVLALFGKAEGEK
jgi:hypothetical protein